jgi:hypothetical protein
MNLAWCWDFPKNGESCCVDSYSAHVIDWLPLSDLISDLKSGSSQPARTKTPCESKAVGVACLFHGLMSKDLRSVRRRRHSSPVYVISNQGAEAARLRHRTI